MAQTSFRALQTMWVARVLPTGTVSTSEAPSGFFWSQGNIDTFKKFSSIYKPWQSMFWLSSLDGGAKSLFCPQVAQDQDL